MIISRTPLRICLGGGGTDLPSYYKKNCGLVVSMAINKHIYITYKPDNFEKSLKLRYSIIEIVKDAQELKNHRAKEALIKHGIYSGCEINSCADLPSNTGLGSSGSFLVGLINCIREYKRMDRRPETLAEDACDIEINILNEPVGKQDQYIAALGGMQVLHIWKNGTVVAEPLDIHESLLPKLIGNMCVYYLNIKRDASDILAEQQKLQGNTETILDIIKQHGQQSIDYLSCGDFDSWGSMMDEYWELKKRLSNKINIPIIDEIYDEAKNNLNVLGGKLIGAGGGGFLLLYCNKNQTQLDSYMASRGFARLYFDVDTRGSTILGNYL